MRTPLLLLALVLLPAARAADPPDPAALLARARSLTGQGQRAAALDALDAARRALPPDDRLVRWRIDFQGHAIPVVLIGKKVLVFTSHVSRGGIPGPPALPDARPRLDDRTGGYDFDTAVTAVDLADGRKLWTRRAPGHWDVALDDRHDHVFLWREKLYRLAPATGEVEQTRDLPARAGATGRVQALVIAGRPYFTQAQRRRGPDGPVTACDIDSGQVDRRDVMLPVRLSPDETRRLHLDTAQSPARVESIVRAGSLRLPPGKAAKTEPGPGEWIVPFPDYASNEPFWFGDDVAFVSGGPASRSEVVRLDGAKGQVKWRFLLPRGVYAPGGDQLPGNAYPPDNWTALGPCGEFLLAVGGEGSLYLLDPATGRLAAKASSATTHLTFPRLADGRLVVAGIDGLRSHSLDVLLGRRAPREREIVLAQANALAALGRPADALAHARELCDANPEDAPAWELAAAYARAADRPDDEVATRCRVLELTGRDQDPVLRQRWGLLRRIATGHDLTAPARLLGDTLYLGTCSGGWRGIDTHSLEVVERRDLPAALALTTLSSSLQGFFSDRESRPLASFAEDPPEPVLPGVPREWYVASGYDGRPVRWQGRRYRPLGGGKVRVLDGATVREYASPLKGITSWNIALTPDGPVGYGAGGVYELDDHLCPAKPLIEARRLGGGSDGEVYLLAAAGPTLAVACWAGDEMELQVWSRDGKTRLRRQAVLPFRPGRYEHCRLLPLAGGYLLTGADLTWLPAAEGPSWHFSFGPQPGRALPRLRFAHASFFGEPVVAGNHLFVPCRDGALYVFDVSRLTAR